MALVHRRVHRLSHPRLTAALACALSLAPGSALAQTPNVRPAPAAARADEESVGRTVAEIDAALGALNDGSAAERRAAAQAFIDGAEVDDVPALRQRVLSPLRVEVEPLRNKIIRAVRAYQAARPNGEYDLLELLVNLPRARDTDVAIERISLCRALGRLRSADAGRALLAVASSNNGLFRQEVGRIIRGGLREYVLPGVIEFRSPSEAMRVFLRQLRESLRKVTPGESVQLHDNALLAEVLRAFGAMHQQDALKVVVSFVNSDRMQVREAARAAVAQYGGNTLHALREAYEMYEGRDPNPAWGWERVARELYAANDRRRAAEVTQAFEQGLSAGREGRHEDMVSRFRFVLSRHPSFDRRAEMVPPLVSYARTLEGRDAVRAQSVYRMALWVDPQGPQSRAVRSAILFLEAERALARGVADPELYRAALRVDPHNERAEAQLDRVEQSATLRARKVRRTLGALGLLGLAASMLWVLLRRPEGRRMLGVRAPA